METATNGFLKGWFKDTAAAKGRWLRNATASVAHNGHTQRNWLSDVIGHRKAASDEAALGANKTRPTFARWEGQLGYRGIISKDDCRRSLLACSKR